jgi:hypothetical protein
MEGDVNDRPGCLVGLLKLFLLDRVFNWLQSTIGFGKGGCWGCGCGIILVIIFLILFISIIFGTDWLRLVNLLGFGAI